MKFIALSDTHGTHQELTEQILEIVEQDPEIQTIIHAGDATNYRNLYSNAKEFRNFYQWFGDLPLAKKIYIPGNHDTSLEPIGLREELLNNPNIETLFHQSTQVEGFTIFGSPYTPAFFDWAFNVPRESLRHYWESIPRNIDILVTHGPAEGVGDVYYWEGELGHYGDSHLRTEVLKIEPQIHVFGHFHDSVPNQPSVNNNGLHEVEGCKTKFYNVSIVNNDLTCVNKVKILEVSR